MDFKIFFCLLLMLAADASDHTDNLTLEKYSCGFLYCLSYRIGDTFEKAVKLKGIPTGVTKYVVYYGDLAILTHEMAHKDKTKFDFNLHLVNETTQIKVKLYKDETLCVDRQILFGRASNRSNDSQTKKIKVMEVNFKDECEVYSNIGDDIKLYCGSQWILHPLNIDQVDNRDIRIEEISTTFTFRAESFDNNTYVTCQKNRRYHSEDNKTRIRLTTNEAGDEYNVSAIIRYSVKKVEFNCHEYFNITNSVQVGIINRTVNSLSALDESEINMEFNINDNNTILSCIYYTIDETEWTRDITRRIEKKTLLIYEELTNDTAVNESIVGSADNSTLIYILVISAVAVIIIILLSILKYKKYHLKQSCQEGTVELETNNTTDGVLYAELDIQHENTQRINRCEESPYAEVIGVLMPRRKN